MQRAILKGKLSYKIYLTGKSIHQNYSIDSPNQPLFTPIYLSLVLVVSV